MLREDVALVRQIIKEEIAAALAAKPTVKVETPNVALVRQIIKEEIAAALAAKPTVKVETPKPAELEVKVAVEAPYEIGEKED